MIAWTQEDQMTKTKKEWRRHYEGWQASGKTQREYCEAVGIKYSTFKNFPGPFQKADDKPVGQFQSIEIVESGENDLVKPKPYCSIAFSNGDEITVSTEGAMDRLKQLVSCLS